MPSLLIRGGDVIDTEPEPIVRRGADVLVADGRIVAVGANLSRDGAEVIDATNRFVLPGLVDTHRHLWQAGLRSLIVDGDFNHYLDLVLRRIVPRLRVADLRVATLAGALECLDAGVTTVQDFSVLTSYQHGAAAVAALDESGIRAVYGAGYPVFDPAGRRPDHVRRLRKEHFATDGGPLTMALAVTGPSFEAIELVEEDWRLADELGLPVVTHVGSGPVAKRPVDALRQRGLLRPNTLYVHGNTLPDEEFELIAGSGGAVSITPVTEAHFGMGPPLINRMRAAGVTAGLGVDVVTTTGGDLFGQMRAALLTGELDELPRATAADVLRLATVDGARALGLGDRIGSLRPGKEADIVLLRADAINLVAAHDPIAAVVTAAHPGNVDTVLVAGRVVKRDGRLLHAVPADELRASARWMVSG